MSVRELLRDLLLELGQPVLADQVYNELEGDEEADTPIGVDCDGDAIRYVERIANEFPSHYALVTERD